MQLGARNVIGLVGAALALLVLAFLLTPVLPGAAQAGAAETCARFVEESAARERAVSGHGDRTAVIGDSYSAGLGLAQPARSWARELPGRVHVFGFSGSGFARGASPCPGVAFDQRAPRALADRPSLVVVEGGLNDHDQPSSAIRDGFRRLISQLGHRQVLVVGPPAAPARAHGAARVDAVLRSEAARVGMPYLSMLGHRFDYLDDRLHLTAAGHRAFGSLVAAELASLR